jgi:quaternary ammonium compound-resistance protein SugE
MEWVYLLGAGLVEIVMALALKEAQAWTRLVPSVVGIGAALASIYLLTRSLAHLPLGTAYAIWTGIGSVGVVLVGIALFGEQASWLRLLCIGLVVTGTMGLRVLEA